MLKVGAYAEVENKNSKEKKEEVINYVENKDYWC